MVKKFWWSVMLLYIVLMVFGTVVVQGRSAQEWVELLVPPGAVHDHLVDLLHNHHPVTFARFLILADYVINFAAFLPVGVALALILQPRVAWDVRWVLACAFGVGAGLSTGIELLQAYVPNRVPSASDVALNTAGVVCGCSLPYVLKASARRKKSGDDSTAGPA